MVCYEILFGKSHKINNIPFPRDIDSTEELNQVQLDKRKSFPKTVTTETPLWYKSKIEPQMKTNQSIIFNITMITSNNRIEWKIDIS